MVRSPALAVPSQRAQGARHELRLRGIERPDLKIRRSGGTVLIPVADAAGAAPEGGRWVEEDFEPAVTIRSYKDVVRVPKALLGDLPTSFDVVGDLVLLKIPPTLARHDAEIGRALLKAHPHLRAVFADEGVQGPFRVRALRRIAGQGPPVTVHREFGIALKVDLAAAYFSPRLAGEHDRVAQQVGPGERVLDATAGVGPYAVAIARRQPAARVVAVDLNPEARALMLANLERNRIEDQVEVLTDDGFDVALRGAPWDRIVVNLPHGQEGRLRQVAQALRPEGVLHATRVLEDTGAAAWGRIFSGEAGLRLRYAAKVHAYAPTQGLYAFDMERTA